MKKGDDISGSSRCEKSEMYLEIESSLLDFGKATAPFVARPGRRRASCCRRKLCGCGMRCARDARSRVLVFTRWTDVNTKAGLVRLYTLLLSTT